MKSKKEETAFVAFAGRNTPGVKWFEYPKFWVNQLGYRGEEVDAISDGIGNNMTGPMKLIDHQL